LSHRRQAGVLLSIITGFTLAKIFYSMPDMPGDVLERLAPFCAAFAVVLLFRERNRQAWWKPYSLT
jgi:hypothetical protein